MAGAPALAGGVGPTATSASPDASLSLSLHGHVSPRCTVALDGDRIDVVMSSRSGSSRLGASVDCNDTMRVDITSRNGALVHEDAATLPRSPGFTSRVPYDVAFDVAASGALPVHVRSEDAAAGAGGSVGISPFHSRARMGVSWRAEAEPFGGTYTDTIEIRVSIAGDTGGTAP